MIQIPLKGFSIKNSEVLSWAHCDSSKPGRSATRYLTFMKDDHNDLVNQVLNNCY